MKFPPEPAGLRPSLPTPTVFTRKERAKTDPSRQRVAPLRGGG